uniref:Uncharacterized protein n=1 Tax=Fagus sylvatica TaxID=28930 RepID=A0A2N9IFV0_FAGSY
MPCLSKISGSADWDHEDGVGEISVGREVKRASVVVEASKARSEGGAGDVVLDEMVDINDDGGVAELDTSHQDEDECKEQQTLVTFSVLHSSPLSSVDFLVAFGLTVGLGFGLGADLDLGFLLVGLGFGLGADLGFGLLGVGLGFCLGADLGVGLRSGRGLILPARGDFARGGLRFLSRCRSGCGLISAWAWVYCGGLRFGLGWWWSRGCGCGCGGLRFGLGVVVEPWVWVWLWWVAFWSRRGGGAVGVGVVVVVCVLVSAWWWSRGCGCGCGGLRFGLGVVVEPWV